MLSLIAHWARSKVIDPLVTKNEMVNSQHQWPKAKDKQSEAK